jgi:hypothetical protein
MLLTKYLSTRRAVIEESIAAEKLAGNEVKLAADIAALAELNGVEREMFNEKFFKISSNENKHIFQINGVSASTALTAIIESIAYKAAVDCCEKFKEIKKLDAQKEAL